MYALLRYKNLLIIAVIIALSGMLSRGVYVGFLREKNTMQAQAQELEKRIEWADKISHTEEKLSEEEGKLLKGDVFEVNKLIQASAQEAGVVIESLRPGKVKKTPQYHKADMSAVIISDYDSMVSFMQSIEATGVVEIYSLRRGMANDDFKSIYDFGLTALMREEK